MSVSSVALKQCAVLLAVGLISRRVAAARARSVCRKRLTSKPDQPNSHCHAMASEIRSTLFRMSTSAQATCHCKSYRSFIENFSIYSSLADKSNIKLGLQILSQEKPRKAKSTCFRASASKPRLVLESSSACSCKAAKTRGPIQLKKIG